MGQRPVLVSIDGGDLFANFSADGQFNTESNLDLQCEDTLFANYGRRLLIEASDAMGLVGNLPVTLYQAGDAVQGSSFNNLLDAIDGSYCTTTTGDDASQDGVYPEGVNCGIAPLTSVI